MWGCVRQALYERLGTPKTNPHDERSSRVFRMGHIIHALVQAGVSATGLSAWPEIEVDAEGVTGHADILVQIDPGNEYELVEIKSIGSMAFKYKELPKPDHVGQAMTYATWLRRHGGVAEDGTVIPPLDKALRKVRMVYVSKDDMKIEEFVLSVDEGMVDDRVNLLEMYREADTLPPRLPINPKTGGRDWRCGYCPFQTKCWEQDPEGTVL